VQSADPFLTTLGAHGTRAPHGAHGIGRTRRTRRTRHTHGIGHRYGLVKMAQSRLRDLVSSCAAHKDKHRRMVPFLRLLGLAVTKQHHCQVPLCARRLKQTLAHGTVSCLKITANHCSLSLALSLFYVLNINTNAALNNTKQH